MKMSRFVIGLATCCVTLVMAMPYVLGAPIIP
jgi:hypothetical protein